MNPTNRRFFSSWSGSLVLLLLLGVPCASAQRKTTSAPERRQLDLDSFEYVWKTIYERHFDPTFGGMDWKAVHEEFRPQVEAARDRRQAREMMTKMISRIGLSHFTIIPAELYEHVDRPGVPAEREGSTGIDLRVIDSHALVTAVEPGSPAHKAGVKPGWEIVRVRDREVPSRLAKLARELEGRPMKDLVLFDAVAGRLSGNIGENVTVKFLDAERRSCSHTLTLTEPKGRLFQYGNLPPIRVWIDVKRLNSGVGYIAINAFIDVMTVMPAFNSALNSFLHAPGIVIDLRGNAGGQAEMAAGMAGWFVREKDKYFGTIQMRDNKLKLVVRPRPEIYAGPVAVLVDGLSLCAAEIFADGMRAFAGARIFGSRTGGAALAGSIERLPNGDGFIYPYANFVTAAGHVLEGNGLMPDVEVKPGREALLQGKDPALEAALEWIKNETCLRVQDSERRRKP